MTCKHRNPEDGPCFNCQEEARILREEEQAKEDRRRNEEYNRRYNGKQSEWNANWPPFQY